MRARRSAVIKGVVTELRGTFERSGDRMRLDGQLQDIDFPIGSAISFCLKHEGRTIPVAVGYVHLENRRRRAEFHIGSNGGQNLPSVEVGDLLQARDGASANGAPKCSQPLLLAGKFVETTARGSSGR